MGASTSIDKSENISECYNNANNLFHWFELPAYPLLALEFAGPNKLWEIGKEHRLAPKVVWTISEGF